MTKKSFIFLTVLFGLLLCTPFFLEVLLYQGVLKAHGSTIEDRQISYVFLVTVAIFGFLFLLAQSILTKKVT